MDPLQSTPISVSRPDIDADDDIAWMTPDGTPPPTVNVVHSGVSDRPFPSTSWRTGGNVTPVASTPAMAAQQTTPQIVAVDSTPAWMESTLATLIRALDGLGNSKPAIQQKRPVNQLSAKVYSPFLGER